MTTEAIKAKIADHEQRVQQLRQNAAVIEQETQQRIGAVLALRELLPAEEPATVTPITAAEPENRAKRRRAAR